MALIGIGLASPTPDDTKQTASPGRSASPSPSPSASPTLSPSPETVATTVPTAKPTPAATKAAPVTASPKPSPTAVRTVSPPPRPVATTASPKPKPVATQPPAKTYANCDAMNKDFAHGVGKPGAVDKTSGTPVTNFHVSTTIYNANTGRDRDKDGIACEKR